MTGDVVKKMRDFEAKMAALERMGAVKDQRAILIVLLMIWIADWISDMPLGSRQFRGDGVEEFAGHCTACEHERLAVAAALRKFIDRWGKPEWSIAAHKTGKPIEDVCIDDLMAAIPPADRSALDAHDEEVRDRALEEAVTEVRNNYIVGPHCLQDRIRAHKGKGSR